MFKFQKEQEIVNIAGVKIGGQPGELPTVLAGTIFYDNHGIVEDAARGMFDRAAAEKLINLQEASAKKTGNPHIIHISVPPLKASPVILTLWQKYQKLPFLSTPPKELCVPMPQNMSAR